MQAENKTCQNCKKDFVIEPEDFNFYEKIKVPPPTFCPECRLLRRLLWRNEHVLFRRLNGNKEKQDSIISVYHPDACVIVYDKETWWSDSWDPCEYGKEYDFSKPFFEQFGELLSKVPHLALSDSKSVNARYCNVTVEMKNCYLVSAAWGCEDSMYCNRITDCKFTHDSHICYSTELAYENVYCRDSNRLLFSRESENCLDSYFLYDCRNCSNCILCFNLRNKNYCIENIQYSKEEYLERKKNLALNTREGIKKAASRFEGIWKNALHRHLKLTNTINVTGDHVVNSRNCQNVFDIAGDFENVKYANWGSFKLQDSYDIGPGAGGSSELTYEGISIGVHNSRCALSSTVWYSSNIFYCYMMNNCRDCFGCSEMNGKQYCILNKQYTKDEYERLLPQIIQHMKDLPYISQKGHKYSYGEFFPPEISPFAYNETIAQDYFPLEQDSAEAQGYVWRDNTSGEFQVDLEGKDLPQTIEEVNDSFLEKVIRCEITGKPFRILPQELDFYRRLDIPLPSVHPDERHNNRLKFKNPMVFRKRECYFGDKEILTTYPPVSEGGPAKVVCAEHYNKEIY